MIAPMELVMPIMRKNPTVLLFLMAVKVSLL
jgi:hypothetical protein